MKIAVLLFGQPRFIDMTKGLIRDEFNLPGHTVHFYAHFWDSIGYIPRGEETEYDTEELYEEIRESIPQFNFDSNFKNIRVQSYEDSDPGPSLNEICEFMSFYSTKLHNRPMTIGKDISSLAYKYGQHLSIKNCFQKIKQYEQKNNFKYDVIVKTRTDIIYKPEESYTSKEEYYETKDKYYTDLNFDIPYVRCTALRFVDCTKRAESLRLNKKGASSENVHCKAFYKKQYKVENSDVWLDYPELNYYNRLCFNDWTLIANREAAEIIYYNWFENYFLTLSKDIRNNKTTSLLISESEHSIQGQFLLNNNIYASRVYKRRDVRLLHPKIIKDEVEIHGKILAHNEKQIRKDLFKRFNGTGR